MSDNNNKEITENGKETENEGQQNTKQSQSEKKDKCLWDKVRSMFDEDGIASSLKDMHGPMLIIAVSCVIIAACVIFIVFTQIGMAKSLKRICAMHRYGFSF